MSNPGLRYIPVSLRPVVDRLLAEYELEKAERQLKAQRQKLKELNKA